MEKEQRNRLTMLYQKMIEYNNADAKRIQHLIKVHSFAAQIAQMEQIEEETTYILEAAALVHDIGIRNCELKYGTCTGKQQELEGPPEAKKMLESLDFEPDVVDRVCYLVGHHHTYHEIDGIDYRILVEADFLVNLYEDNAGEEAVRSAKENIFQTKSGIYLLTQMYGIA